MTPPIWNSPQHLFDTVVDHLIRQGEPSYRTGPNLQCAYRGVNGLRCAIGCLIPDDQYKPDWEGYGIITHGEVSRQIAKAAGIQEHLKDLAQDLQDAHDDVGCSIHHEPGIQNIQEAFRYGMDAYFKQIAQAHNITYRGWDDPTTIV